MRTNKNWPESFGFVIGGRAPVVILSVKANSVAQNAGLQPGDQILELNGENVQGLSKEEITLLARRSRRVPPALAVISRIRTFQLRRKRSSFGFTVWGRGPVYIDQVDRGGPAHGAGIKSGDLILQINSIHVRHSDKEQVHQIIESCGPVLSIVLIAGSHSIGSAEKRGDGSSTSRYRYARDFYYQMNYYLAGQESKKGQLMKALNQYAKDRSVEQLCKSLNIILQTPTQRKLLRDIRPLIPKKHRPLYDVILGTTPDVAKNKSQALEGGSLPRQRLVASVSDYNGSEFLDSMSQQDGFRTWSHGTSTPLSDQLRRSPVEPPRNVLVRRAGAGAGFGFTLTGDAPVCIRSVDRGGPADMANLKPGDHILAINGLNVRGKSHGHVVELLKGSGSNPTLLVQWRPNSSLYSAPSSPVHSNRSVRFGNARPGSSISRSSSRVTQTSFGTEYLPNGAGNGVHEHRGLARRFKYYMNQLLTPGEQLVVKQSLHAYQKDRNIPKLLRALEPVLDDGEKLQMLHFLSDLLPENEQEAFDRAAALLIAKYMENGVVPGSRTTDTEVMDVLYRVQGNRLNDIPRQRNLIGGGAASPESPRHWPRSGAVTQNRWNDISHVGGELDTVPVRDRNGVSVGVGTEDEKADDEEEDGDDYNDELDLGLVELADALLALDAEKAAKASQSQDSTIEVQVEVHSPKPKSPQQNGTIVAFEDLPVDAADLSTQSGNVPEELKGLTPEEMRVALATRTQQLEQAKSEVEEAKRRAERIENEQKDAGSTPSTASEQKDLVSAVKARLEKEDTSSEPVKTADVPPPPAPPPPGAPPPPPPPPPPSLAPPPPPGGMFVDGTPRMQLKRVNWEKLSIAGIENTVWAQLHDDQEPLDNVIEFMQLEQNFRAVQRKRGAKEEKKPDKPVILDPKKSYNISILLGHLKMSFDEIRHTMMTMDEEKFSEAHLRQLLVYAPDGVELQKYKYFADDPKKLEIADRFSLEMSKVPGYTQRLRALLFKARFADKVDEIKPDLEAVIQASQDLQASTKMTQILKLVLATGNYMNKGNARIAGAAAFKISFLTKLSSTKTTDNKSTLLHVLVSTIENKYPEVLDVKKELESVLIAAKVSYQMVASDIEELEKGMQEMKKDLGVFKSRQSRLEGDRFNEAVNQIITSTEGELQTILDLQTKMLTKFNDVVKFFGENEAKMTTEDFFGYFAVFLINFERTHLEITKKAQLEEEKAKREKQREERSKKLKEAKERGDTDEPTAELSKSFDAINMKRLIRKQSEEGSVSPLSGDASSLSSGEFEVFSPRTDSSSNKSQSISPRDSNESLRNGNTDNVFRINIDETRVSSLPYSEKKYEKVPLKDAPKSVALTAKNSPPLILKPKPATKPKPTSKPAPKPKPAIAPKPKVETGAKSKPSSNHNVNIRPGMSTGQSSFEEKSLESTNGSSKIELKSFSGNYSEIEFEESLQAVQEKGVKGISSLFESKISDSEREAMYAKPVKTVKKNNNSNPKKDSFAESLQNDEIPPPIPPRLDEDIHLPTPDSPYNDPGPPDFRPPLPPGVTGQTITKIEIINKESPATIEENSYSDVTSVVAPKDLSPYSDVDIISRIPVPHPAFKDSRDTPGENKNALSKESSVYEDVEDSVNGSRIQIPKTDSIHVEVNTLTPTYEDVSSINRNPPKQPPPYKSQQKSVAASLSKGETVRDNISELHTLNPTYEDASPIHRAAPPKKTPPYKPKQESVPPSLSKEEFILDNVSDQQPSFGEKTLPTSPQFAVVIPGSPRLASAEIKSNSSPDIKTTPNFNFHPQNTTAKPFAGKGSLVSSGNSSARPSPPPPVRVSSLMGSQMSSPRSSHNASPVASKTSPPVPPLKLDEIIQEQADLTSPNREDVPPSFKPPPLSHSQSAHLPLGFGVKPQPPSGTSFALIQELMEKNKKDSLSVAQPDSDRDSVDNMICPPPPKFSPILPKRDLPEYSINTSEHVGDSNLDSFVIPPPPPSNEPPSPLADDIGFDFLSSLSAEEKHSTSFAVVAPPPSQTLPLPNFSQHVSTSQNVMNPVAGPSLSSVGLEDLDEVPSRDVGAVVSDNIIIRPLVPPMRKQR